MREHVHRCSFYLISAKADLRELEKSIEHKEKKIKRVEDPALIISSRRFDNCD